MVLPGMERTSIAVPSDDATSPWKKWNDGIAVEIIRSVDENSDALRHVHAGQLVIPPVDERRTVSFPLMQPLPSTCRLDGVLSHEAASSHEASSHEAASHEAASHEATIHLTKRRRIVTSLRDRCFKVQGIPGRNGRLIPATEYVLAILPHEMRAVDFFDTATVFPMAGTTANGEDAFAFAYGGAATAHQNDVRAQGDGTVGDALARHRACYAILRATHAASQELHRLRTAHTEAMRQLRDDDDKAQARSTTLNKLRHDDERTYDTELLAMQRLLRHTQQGMRHDLHTLDNELQRQLTRRRNDGDCPPRPHPPPMLRRGQPITDMEKGAVAPPVTHSWSSPLLQ